MKGTPIQLLKGNTLRTQIYNSLSHHKLASTTRLLRHTLKSQLRQSDYDSQESGMKTEMCSPVPKTDNSLQKMSKSVNESWVSKKGKGKSGSKSRGKITVKEDKKKEKVKSKSEMLPKTKGSVVEKGKSDHKKAASKDKLKNKSTTKGSKNINLESIIQQSSSDEQLLTPQHRSKLGSQRSPNSLNHSRTKKKQKPQLFSESVKRKIEKSFKQPDRFQKLLKLPQLTVSYRIIKRRLIEVEIYTLKPIKSLRIMLNKGNLQCQNIQEQYSAISANTILALFSSVRGIDTDNILDFPKIDLAAEFQDQKVERSMVVPYTWLHYTDQHTPSIKKSKIKIKLCLCDLPINSTSLHVLSDIFRTWLKKSNKGHSEFESSFTLCQHDYSLKLVEQAHQKFTLELEGKGQNRLLSMIEFLQRLIS